MGLVTLSLSGRKVYFREGPNQHHEFQSSVS